MRTDQNTTAIPNTSCGRLVRPQAHLAILARVPAFLAVCAPKEKAFIFIAIQFVSCISFAIQRTSSVSFLTMSTTLFSQFYLFSDILSVIWCIRLFYLPLLITKSRFIYSRFGAVGHLREANPFSIVSTILSSGIPRIPS